MNIDCLFLSRVFHIRLVILGYTLLGLLLLLNSACSNQTQDTITYTLRPSDFSESIKVSGTVQAVNIKYINAPRIGLVTISSLSKNGEIVSKGDTICSLEHPELISNFEKFKLELEEMQAEFQKLNAGHMLTLAMLEAEIENNNIQLSINSLDSIQQKFAPPIQQKLISLEQKKSNILARKLEKKYASQKEISETEIRGMKSRIKMQENRIDRMQDEVDQLILTAPSEGIVVRTNAPEIQLMGRSGSMTMGGDIKEGSTVFPGMKILEMPDMNQMQVMIDLSESEYKRVEQGQKVSISVDAKNKLYTTGTIKRKILAGKKINYDSDVKVYEAIVEVDSCHLQITPGLSTSCEILINEVKDTIIIPAIAVFGEDSEKFVYVSIVETRCGVSLRRCVSLRRGVSLRPTEKYMKVKVETGPANSTHVIICKGLNGNETISLRKPSANKILRTISNNMDTLEYSKDSLRNTIHPDSIPNTKDSLKISNQ